MNMKLKMLNKKQNNNISNNNSQNSNNNTHLIPKTIFNNNLKTLINFRKVKNNFTNNKEKWILIYLIQFQLMMIKSMNCLI